MQGNAPLLSVTPREKDTPESSYPLSHIRQDERAGRDSQGAFAQRASKGRGGRFPATTTAALLDGSLPPIRERSDTGSRPSHSSSRRGTAHPLPGRKIPHIDNRGVTRAGPFAPIPREIGFRVPSCPSRRQPRKNRPPSSRIAKSTSGGSGPVASSRSTRSHMLSAGSNFPLSSL